MLNPRTVLLEIEIDAMLKPRTIHTEIKTDSMLKPRTVLLEVEIDAVLKPRTTYTENMIEAMLNPRTALVEIEIDHSQKPVRKPRRTFSINLTFEIENTFFSECRWLCAMDATRLSEVRAADGFVLGNRRGVGIQLLPGLKPSPRH